MFDRAVRILSSAFLLFAILFASAALATSAQAQEDGAGHEGPQHRRERFFQKRLETVPPDRRRRIPPRLEGRRLGESLLGASGAKRRQSAANLVMRAAAGLTGVRDGSTSIADIDGDGNQDLLITGNAGTPFNANLTATLYLGDGQGGFTEANAGLTGATGGSTSIADVDGDGNQDLLITGFDPNFDPSATLYMGDGQGGFSEASAGLSGVEDGSTSIADVDGDGNLDLLITGAESFSNRTATLYMGDGQGGFSEAGAGLTGVKGGSASIADVDGDGNQDLLITGRDANGEKTATLYLGAGDGSFEEANAGLTGVDDVSSTSIADVDGDGNQDLLITGLDPNFDPSATLYLGDGQGGFSEADAGLTGVEFSATSIADLDGDEDQDLLITGSGALLDPGLLITGSGESLDSSARVYINRQNQSPPNRAPTFAQGFSYDQPMAPGTVLRRAVEAGDLDGDSLSIQLASGTPNVTVSDRGNGTAEVVFTPGRSQGGDMATLTVEASDPDGATGSFSTQVEVSPFVATFSVGLAGVSGGSTSIADVDGDGNEDLLVTGSDENLVATATLYLGNGQGGFDEANASLTGVSGGSTSIADVDGDGNEDLLVTGNVEDLFDPPIATLYLGNGQGGFSEANADLTGVGNGASTSVADVNGDENLDLLITGRDPNSDPTATLYLGDGQGGFTEANASLTGVRLSANSIADVDGDGNQDLLITGRDANSDETATLYLGVGDGSFEEANADLNGVENGSTSIADVNGDGNQDVLITGEGEGPNATLHLGDGQGGFSEANASLMAVEESSTSIADMNGDGNQDVLITGFDGESPAATLYLGDGQGGFSVANAGLSGVSFSSTSIGDIDGDADPDLLATGYSLVSHSPSSLLYENLFDNPLPVEMAGFEATTDGDEVQLTWQTASETNNAGFEVQRRATGTDGAGWTEVGFVESKAAGGTTEEPKSYRFTDENLPFAANRLKYRLKQVDLDGSTSLTDPVSVERAIEELRLEKTFPNPAQGQATVRFAVPERQEVRLELYDVLGRQVRSVRQGEAQGRQELQVDLSGLSSGTYFMRLKAEGAVKTQRLTVVR